MPHELTPRQAAERIGATTRSVQRWIALGSLPARRVGGRWRVASGAIDAFRAEPSPAASEDAASAATRVKPIRTLFIANRGEIATRIRRTADRLGIRVVVPGAEGQPSVDLLDIEAVVTAALLAGADALHPGFGFLSENAAFADAVEAAGIRWVGPSGAAIRAMGDKAAARRLATKLGVPIVPGYDGDDQSDNAFLDAARKIAGRGPAGRRHQVLVKPAAGGGGKGMRVVASLEPPDAFLAALAGARREALASFGDERLIGLSTHTVEQLDASSAEPVDYLAIGPVFGTQGALAKLDLSACRVVFGGAAGIRSTDRAGLGCIDRGRNSGGARGRGGFGRGIAGEDVHVKNDSGDGQQRGENGDLLRLSAGFHCEPLFTSSLSSSARLYRLKPVPTLLVTMGRLGRCRGRTRSS